MLLRSELPCRIWARGTPFRHSVLNHFVTRCGASSFNGHTVSARGVAPLPAARIPRPPGSVPSELEDALNGSPDATERIPEYCHPPNAPLTKPLLERKNGSG